MVCAASKHHLPIRPESLDAAVAFRFDADGTLAVQQHAACERHRSDFEVRAAHCRAQIGACRRYAATVPDRSLAVAVAVRLGNVEIVELGVAERGHAVVERLAQAIAAAREADAHWPARGVIRRALVFGVVLGTQEIRQQVRI